MGELLVYQRVHAVSFRATLNFLQKNHDFPFKMRYIKSHYKQPVFFCFDPSPTGGSNFHVKNRFLCQPAPLSSTSMAPQVLGRKPFLKLTAIMAGQPTPP